MRKCVIVILSVIYVVGLMKGLVVASMLYEPKVWKCLFIFRVQY